MTIGRKKQLERVKILYIYVGEFQVTSVVSVLHRGINVYSSLKWMGKSHNHARKPIIIFTSPGES